MKGGPVCRALWRVDQVLPRDFPGLFFLCVQIFHMIFMANPAKIALSGSHTAKSRLVVAGPLADRISFFQNFECHIYGIRVSVVLEKVGTPCFDAPGRPRARPQSAERKAELGRGPGALGAGGKNTPHPHTFRLHLFAYITNTPTLRVSDFKCRPGFVSFSKHIRLI